MKPFSLLESGDARRIDQEELVGLVSRCTPDQIEKVKALFWNTAGQAGGREKFQNTWGAAIDALPDTDAFHKIHIMELEVSIDIIKRILGEEQ